MKEKKIYWISFPTLVLVFSLALWPAEEASARKIFNTVQGPTADQCRICHNDLEQFPQHLTTIPNRHHRRVGNPIRGLGNGTHQTVAPGDKSTGKYTCLTCHELERGSQGYFEFKPFRDCLRCHSRESVTGSPGSNFDNTDIIRNVHKHTQTYFLDLCEDCHKSPLANFNNQLSDKVAGDYDYSTHPLISPPEPINGPCGYGQGDDCAFSSVGFDHVSSGSAISTTRLTISHTTSGTNRLMLVGVAIEDNADRNVTSMSYSGQAMTLVGAKEINKKSRTEIWKLVAPPTGNGNVVINFNGPIEKGAVAGVMTFINVNQIMPLGPFASASGDGETQPKVNVSAAVGDLVFATGMHWGNPIGDPGAGAAEQWDRTIDKVNGAGSTKIATSNPVTMSWSNTAADWALGGVAIKPN